MEERGAIYKGTYEGWYAVSDEEFLTDAQVSDSEEKADDGSLVKVQWPKKKTGNHFPPPPKKKRIPGSI